VTINAGVAQVELGVQVDAPNASLAQAQVAQTAQNIVTTLQNLNVRPVTHVSSHNKLA
jgi:uncharacterized protein YggE